MGIIAILPLVAFFGFGILGKASLIDLIATAVYNTAALLFQPIKYGFAQACDLGAASVCHCGISKLCHCRFNANFTKSPRCCGVPAKYASAIASLWLVALKLLFAQQSVLQQE